MELPRHDNRQVANSGQPSDQEHRYRRVLDKQVKDHTASLALKANIASPTLTGDPKAPTPAASDSDTSIATTAHVTAAIASKSPVLQILENVYTTNADLSTTIPADDTIPLIGEGTEVLTQAITTAAAANKVLCSVRLWGITITNVIVTAALFRGTTCINAAGLGGSTNVSGVQDIEFSKLDSPGSAAAHTYSVRVGASSGPARLNGTGAARLYGGVSACTLTLMEIKG